MNECYGIPAEVIARICKVDVKTARRWKNGENRMPETARMILAGDLGAFDPAFSGWSLRNGKLISPEGWEASPGDVLSIQLTQAQLATARSENRALKEAMEAARGAHIEDQPIPSEVIPMEIGQRAR